MTDVRTFPVGHKKPAREDARTLMLAKFLNHEVLPTPPAALTYANRVHPWGMYANDKVGDCTLAGAAHLIMAWAALEGRHIVPSVKAITTLYKHLSPNDEGLVLLDVLSLWRHTGIAKHQIHAYTKLDRHDLRQQVKLSIMLFGGVYAGLMLPESAQDQVGKLWEVPATGAAHGAGRKGSWGGHCIVYEGYDDEGVDVITWGTKQRATWEFVETYGDEEYGILTQDWASVSKPSGINFSALQNQLAQLGH